MTAAVRVEGLRKRYGRVEVLRGVTFSVQPGEVVGLVGPNGAGKTTTLRVLATLARPSEGSASVCGWDVARHPDRVRACVGVVPEHAGVYGRLSGRETLRYYGALCGLRGEELHRRVGELVAWLGMAEFVDRPAGAYSRGMRQRLHLARALLHNPRVLILDEPTAGLDEPTAQAVRDRLRALAHEGRGVLLTTHLAREAQLVCDRVVVLWGGQVRAELHPDQLASAPQLAQKQP